MKIFRKLNINLLKFDILCMSQNRSISFRKASEWYRNWWHSETKPPYKHVVQIGDPVLRHPTEIVPEKLIKESEIQDIITHLKYVLKKYKSVGLSAPQIGIPWRIFVMELTPKDLETFPPDVQKNRQMGQIDFTAFINPTIRVIDYQKVVFPEACESVRGFSADVPRYLKVECTGFNPSGEKIKLTASGWTARIIQHEIDHLDGLMYTDIMIPKSLTCTCWHAVNVHSGRIKLPFSP